MPRRRIMPGTMFLVTLAASVSVPLSGASGHQQAKHNDANEAWAAPTFHGLTIGKSNTTDVLRTFGKPSWKGGVQEIVIPSDKEGEIQYQYSSVPDVDGSLEIICGKRSGVVTAILLYPKHMTRGDAISKFGSEFEESNEKLGPCPTASERKTVAQYHVEYGVLLVYRKLGLYVDIKKDGTAFLIAYLIRCR